MKDYFFSREGSAMGGKGLVPRLLIGWILALTLLSAACAPAAPAPTPAPPAAPTATPLPAKAEPAATPAPKPAALTPVKMVMSPFTINTLPVYVAQKEGHFKQEGLDVSWKEATSVVGLASMAAGEVLMMDSASSALAAAIQGAPFKVHWAGARPNQFIWVRDPVKTAADLKGKRFACSSVGDAGCRMTQNALKKLGGEEMLTAVTYVSVGGGQPRLAALKAGTVAGAYFSSEHYAMLPLEGQGYHNLGNTADLEMVYGGFSTSNMNIAKNRPLLKAAIRGIAKGYRWMLANEDKTVKYMVESRKGLEEADARANYVDWVKLFQWKDGLLPDKAIKETLDFQREVLEIKEADWKFTAEQGFDFSFAREARDELNAAGWKP